MTKLGFADAQNDFFGTKLTPIEQKDLLFTLSNNQRWCDKQVFIDEPRILPLSNQNEKTTSLPSSIDLTTPPQKKISVLSQLFGME